LSHPSIVTIFDAGEQEGLPWIAFEYIDGDQLEARLKQPEQMQFETILSIALDITSALHHAHECGIIHRDIKPANILIDKRTHIAKLADFGVVKAPWIALTQDGSAVGSPGYMSPEQLDGTGANSRSDLFSLGIVLYQMLTGKHPFLRYSIPATIFATLHSNYEPIEKLRPDTPEYLQEIVTGLLENDQKKRIQTAAKLLHLLRSGSRETHTGKDSPAFDKNAFLGNTTRLHRISRTLNDFKKRSLAVISSRILHKQFQRFTDACSHLFKRHPNLDIRRFSIRRSHIVMSFILFLLSLLTIIILTRIPRISPEEEAIIEQLQKEGYPKKTMLLTDTCAALISQGNLTAAESLARKLAGIRKSRSQAQLLLSCIALQNGDDSCAIVLLSAASKDKVWPVNCRRTSELLTRSSAIRMTKSRMDSTLNATLAASVFDYLPDSIPAWMNNVAYWLRWNSVHIAEQLALPIDSVSVYILDLRHAGSVRTRRRAATRLGEIGDERAVPALQKTAALGFRDPIVSHTAKMVLENYFKPESDDKDAASQTSSH